MSINIDGIVITDKQILQAYNAFMNMPLEEKINMVSLSTSLKVSFLKRNYTIGEINKLFQTCVVRPFVEKVSEDKDEEE